MNPLKPYVKTVHALDTQRAESPSRRPARVGASGVAVLCAAFTALSLYGCGASRQQVTQTSSRTVAESSQTADGKPSRGVRQSVNTVGEQHALLVCAATTPPGAARVTEAVSRALKEQRLRLAGDQEDNRVDLIVMLVSSERSAGAWGGIPSREVLLRYELIDARSREPLCTGVDSARYADPSPARAIDGALRRAAQNIARKIRGKVAQLPPPAEEAPAVTVARPEAETALACLPFKNATGQRQLDGWCESLAAIAAQELRRLGTYRIVERARLRDVFQERELAAAIETSPGAVRQVARQLGVDLLMVGEVARRPDGDLAISARIVTADGAEVQRVIYAAGSPNRVDALELAFRHQVVSPRPGWVTRQLDQLRRAPIVWPSGARR